MGVQLLSVRESVVWVQLVLASSYLGNVVGEVLGGVRVQDLVRAERRRNLFLFVIRKTSAYIASKYCISTSFAQVLCDKLDDPCVLGRIVLGDAGEICI